MKHKLFYASYFGKYGAQIRNLPQTKSADKIRTGFKPKIVVKMEIIKVKSKTKGNKIYTNHERMLGLQKNPLFRMY